MTAIDFDPEAIRRLANILRDADLTEIDITEADRRIRVVRAPAAVTAATPLASAVAPAAPVAPPSRDTDDVAPVGAVTSPMVGVAYLSPDPSSAPFAAIGAVVTAGQTVMLIEAMKTFNQIKAPHAGTVTQILVASGQPVEYGQPLLVIA